MLQPRNTAAAHNAPMHGCLMLHGGLVHGCQILLCLLCTDGSIQLLTAVQCVDVAQRYSSCALCAALHVVGGPNSDTLFLTKMQLPPAPLTYLQTSRENVINHTPAAMNCTVQQQLQNYGIELWPAWASTAESQICTLTADRPFTMQSVLVLRKQVSKIQSPWPAAHHTQTGEASMCDSCSACWWS